MGDLYDSAAVRRLRTTGAPAGLCGRLVALLRVWRQRSEQRRQLARLDEHMLRDIGISRAEAAKEARKPFWRR